MKPTPMKPRIIIAQVEGSGTAWIRICPDKAMELSFSGATVNETLLTANVNSPPSYANVCGAESKVTITAPDPEVTLPVITSVNSEVPGLVIPAGAVNETKRLKWLPV